MSGNTCRRGKFHRERDQFAQNAWHPANGSRGINVGLCHRDGVYLRDRPRHMTLRVHEMPLRCLKTLVLFFLLRHLAPSFG